MDFSLQELVQFVIYLIIFLFQLTALAKFKENSKKIIWTAQYHVHRRVGEKLFFIWSWRREDTTIFLETPNLAR